MKKYLRNIVFLVSSLVFYFVWINGGETAYGKLVATGIDKFTTKVSKIESVEYKHFEKKQKTLLYLKYPDRTTKIALEYCLPVVLLLAWQFSLFFDHRIKVKYAFKLLGMNFLTIYFLQIIFPLLLFNISQSKTKSMGLFIGLQIFGFIVFFLILKDSLLIKNKNLSQFEN